MEQISVSTTPFDVRQSGFTGGAINAVPKSGTTEFKGKAYMYTSNTHLTGNKVEDYELCLLYTSGILISLGIALVLIFFIENPFYGLIISQMILSIQLPFMVFLQVGLTSSKRVMGKYAKMCIRDSLKEWDLVPE